MRLHFGDGKFSMGGLTLDAKDIMVELPEVYDLWGVVDEPPKYWGMIEVQHGPPANQVLQRWGKFVYAYDYVGRRA